MLSALGILSAWPKPSSSSLSFLQSLFLLTVPAWMLELHKWTECEHSGKSKFYTQTLKYLQATHFQPSICKQYVQIHCSKFTLLWSHMGKVQQCQLMYTVSCHNMNCKQLGGIVQLTASGQELQTEKKVDIKCKHWIYMWILLFLCRGKNRRKSLE